MLAPEELAEIRADVEATLPDVCNVVSLQRTRDARGQVSEVSVNGPDFACAVHPVDVSAGSLSTDAEIAARLGTSPGWRILMPLDVIVTEVDQIGFDVEGESRLVNIIGAIGPRSNAALREVIVAEAPA